MTDILLALALVFTVGHILTDVVLATRHMMHLHELAFNLAALVFLGGHILFTGEAARWLQLLR